MGLVEQEPLVAARRPVVVCVDDEPPVLRSLRRLLRHEPYDFRTTPRADEALQWVEEEDIDLVLSDQRMPGMLGTELLALIRDRSPRTGRLILTAYPESVPAESRERGTVDGVLFKPWDDGSLKHALVAALRGAKKGPGEAPAEIEEAVFCVDCTIRTIPQVLQSLTPILSDVGTANVHFALALRNLDRLKDSVSRFLKELARRVDAAGLETVLIDPSGLSASFVRVLGPAFPRLTARP